jgi:5'-methylthioinosine phosphorylase
VGIERIIAVGAVGGISEECSVGAIVVPDQIIDYTAGRQNTYFDGGEEPVEHIDFSYPYNEILRCALITSAKASDQVNVVESGVYGATQGPRLETAAEIRRMANDGCTIVGMTGMPEAALAAELGIAYACLGVVINAAAGTNDKPIDTTELPAAIAAAMENVRQVLNLTLQDARLR